MNCSWTKRHLAEYQGGELAWLQRLAARAHLRWCEDCFEAYERAEDAAAWTNWLTPVRPPNRLEMSIRVAISHEQYEMRGLRGWLRSAQQRVAPMLRPLAIRSAGVLASSLLLFGLLIYMAQALFTAPSIEVMGPYALSQDATVLAFVDMRGGVYDIELPADLAGNVRLRSELTNALLFTEFHPATRFGQPVPGQVLIHFTRTTVRG
jgi:hypothetical protein